MLANNTYLTKILFRRDTATNWANNNPVLSEGEPGYEVDTGLFKLGDGVKAWNDLAYSNTFRAMVPEVTADGKLYARTRAVDAIDGTWQEIIIPDISDKADKVFTQLHEVLLFPDTCSQLYFGAVSPRYFSLSGANNPREIRFQSNTTFFTITQTVDHVIKISATKDVSSGIETENTLYNGTNWLSSETNITNDDVKFVFNAETRIAQFITISTNTITTVNLLEDNYDGDDLISTLELTKVEDVVYNLEDIYNQMGRVDDIRVIEGESTKSIVNNKQAIIPNYTEAQRNVTIDDITKLYYIYRITFNEESNPVVGDFDFKFGNIHLVGNLERNYIALNSVVLFDGTSWADSQELYTVFNWDKTTRTLTPTNMWNPAFTYGGGYGVQPNWTIVGDIKQQNGLLTNEIYDSINNKKVDKISEETFIPIKVGDIANTLYLRKPEKLPTETTLIGIKVVDEEEDRLAIALTPEGRITLENALNNFDGTGSELYNGTEFVSAGGTAMSVTIYFNESTGELRFVPISSIKGKNLVISNVPNIAAPTYIRGIKDNFDLSDMYIEYKTLADKKSIVDTFELSQNILEGYEDEEICLNRTTGGNLLYGSYINITNAIMNAGETFTYKLPSGIYNVIQYSGIWNTFGDINERYTIPFNSREFSCYIKQDNTDGVTFNIENNGDRDVTLGNASLYIVYNKEGE